MNPVTKIASAAFFACIYLELILFIVPDISINKMIFLTPETAEEYYGRASWIEFFSLFCRILKMIWMLALIDQPKNQDSIENSQFHHLIASQSSLNGYID